MNAHVERLVSTGRSGLTPLSKFAAWMNAKWEARRARRTQEEAIDFLRAMEPKLLEDIGVDINKLGKPAPVIALQNPHVIATVALSSSPSSRHQDPL